MSPQDSRPSNLPAKAFPQLIRCMFVDDRAYPNAVYVHLGLPIDSELRHAVILNFLRETNWYLKLCEFVMLNKAQAFFSIPAINVSIASGNSVSKIFC